MEQDDRTLVSVVPEENNDRPLGLYHAAESSGFICPLDRPNSARPVGFTPRIVNAKVDFDLLRAWMYLCLATHGSHVESQRLVNSGVVPSLRVIDCRTRKVVMASPKCDYICLSYVWGHMETEIPARTTENGGIILPEILPNVVEDAISVVLELRTRYLWVDRYCILQDDEDDKHHQIRNMDLIYRNAQATIIAAAGSSPTHGLPGVGKRLRSPQPSARLADCSLVSTLPNPKEFIRKSKWMTRAWVYQEAIFSKRRLIFTDQQVYFECPSMCCYEAVDTSPAILQSPSHARGYSGKSIFRRLGHFAGGNDILDHIAAYSRLNLTYETDVLNGISGIFRAYEEFPIPIRHIWGLPFIVTGTGKSSWTAGLAGTLQWRPSIPCRRRLGFPSWSWTGWIGPISFYQKCAVSQPKCKDIKFWVEYENGDLVELQEFQGKVELGCLTMTLKPFLYAETWVTQLRFEFVSEKYIGRTSLGHTPEDTAPPRFFAKYSETPQIYCELFLSEVVQEGTEMHQRLQTELWDCLVLGYNDLISWQQPLYLLVFRWDGHIAERIGYVDTRNLVPHRTVKWDEHLLWLKTKCELPLTKRKIRLG